VDIKEMVLTELTNSVEFIVVPDGLAAEARKLAPDAQILVVDDFGDSTALDSVVAALAAPKSRVNRASQNSGPRS
jgi:mannitol-specific phosphotransferase system IIBC component